MKRRLIVGCIVCVSLSGCMANWKVETKIVDGKVRTTFMLVTEVDPNAAAAELAKAITPG